MLEVYSVNTGVTATTPIPFENVHIKKGCTATPSGTSSIQLNKCGVYMVTCDASAETATTIQLYRDGVAQPQAQGIGTTPCFITLVQVTENNCNCPCSSPTTLQVMNTVDTVFTNVNLCVTKIV